MVKDELKNSSAGFCQQPAVSRVVVMFVFPDETYLAMNYEVLKKIPPAPTVNQSICQKMILVFTSDNTPVSYVLRFLSISSVLYRKINNSISNCSSQFKSS